MVGLREPRILGEKLGTFCVHVFFAISGYMITQSFIRSRSVSRFTGNRLLRIVPAFVLAHLFTRLLWYRFDDYPTNPIPHINNGPIWTIPWEIICYILVGLMGVLGVLNTERFSVFFTGVLVFALADGHWASESYLMLMPLMLIFAGGSFLAIYESRININHAAGFAVVAAVLVETESSLRLVERTINMLPWLYGPGSGVSVTITLLYLFALPVLALWLGRYAPPVLTLRNDLSYGTYLYGWQVQQVVVALAAEHGWRPHPLVLFLIALAGTLPLAWASWQIIEKPALRLKAFDLGRRRKAGA